MVCRTCGKSTDVCYTDEGALGLTHGFCQCRECYIKSGHPECSQCKELLSSQFRYCPWGGNKVKRTRGRQNMPSQQPPALAGEAVIGLAIAVFEMMKKEGNGNNE